MTSPAMWDEMPVFPDVSLEEPTPMPTDEASGEEESSSGEESSGEEMSGEKMSGEETSSEASSDQKGPTKIIDDAPTHIWGTTPEWLRQTDAATLAQVFSHVNIVSLTTTQSGGTTHLFWDYCNEGNLAIHLNNSPRPEAPTYYQPEALCWHVLRSLLRAVTHLHDGKRFDRSSGEWVSTMMGWNAILHRDIVPENIFFRSTTSGATYGSCKLANFEKAVVTAHVPHTGDHPSNETWPVSAAMTVQEGYEPLCDTWPKMMNDPDSWHPDKTLYTLADELFSIGSVIFTMMTGYGLVLKCFYGCSHVARCSQGGCITKALRDANCNCIMGCCPHLPLQGCQHDKFYRTLEWDPRCRFRAINLESWLHGVRYSVFLRDALRLLLSYDSLEPRVVSHALPVTLAVEQLYNRWRMGTPEGWNYVDGLAAST